MVSLVCVLFGSNFLILVLCSTVRYGTVLYSIVSHLANVVVSLNN